MLVIENWLFFGMVFIKTPSEISIMAEGGRILAKIMRELEKAAKPGIATKELDRLAESLIFSYGAEPSFKGYEGYPSCLCASINEQVVHAAPSERILKEGDILSLDLGVKYKGFHTDMAITVPVGKIGKEAEKLIKVTKKSLEIGIKKIKPGNKIGDISLTVQSYVESQGFSVVRELCGHGIGKDLHEEPEILNFVLQSEVSASGGQFNRAKFSEDQNITIEQGMVLCPEPMVVIGGWQIRKGKDGFSFETEDGSLACHFEHTIAVTKTGCQVLTK